MPEKKAIHPHLRSGRSHAAVTGACWSLLHTFLPTISAAAVFFVSAFYLSPSDFGVLGLAGGIVSVGLGVSPLAFGEALVQRQNILESHADSVFWLTVIFGFLLFGLFLFGAAWFARITGEPLIALLLPVLALRVPLELLATVPNAMIVRAMRFKMVALRTAMATLVSAPISVGLLLIGYGIWALAISQVVASFVVVAMAFWAARWRPGFQLNIANLAEVTRYGLFASGNRMLATIKFDRIVIGSLGGTGLLGLYIFAQRFYHMLTEVVSGSLSSVSHALFSTLQSDREKARTAFSMAAFAAASFGLPMFTGAAILIDDIVLMIFGQKWTAAAPAAQVFCIGGLVASIGVVQGALIRSQGRADWWFWFQFVQQCTTLLIIVVAFRFGLTIMIAAIVAKNIIIWPVSVWMTARLLRCSALDYLWEFRGPVVATIFMAMAVGFLPTLLPEVRQLTELTLQILTGVVFYGLTLGAISRARVAEIGRHLRRREPVVT